MNDRGKEMGILPTYIVFTTDREFAVRRIDMLARRNSCTHGSIVRTSSNIDGYERYHEDGARYLWVKPAMSARGYRYSEADIDIATCGLDAIRETILPMGTLADRHEGINIVSSNTKVETALKMIEYLNKIVAIKGNIDIKRYDSEWGNEDISGLCVENGTIIID